MVDGGMVYDGLWSSMVVYGMVYDGLWWSMVVYAGLLWSMG